MRLRFPRPEDDITVPSKIKAEPHLGGSAGMAPSSCERPCSWRRVGCTRGPHSLQTAQPPTRRWARGRDGQGLGFSQFSQFSKCRDKTTTLLPYKVPSEEEKHQRVGEDTHFLQSDAFRVSCLSEIKRKKYKNYCMLL